MWIETNNTIYEDTLDKLVLVKETGVHGDPVYRCKCGERKTYNLNVYSNIEKPTSRQYVYTCGCGNLIKILIKDIHQKV